MAEINAKHNVQQIPAGPEPTPYKGEGTRVEISNIPDYQGTLSRFGADTNWMSALGSAVATRASNAIAAKLGSELGKNPKGELGPSFTDFDKQFQQSYAAQAQSTLGLQAQKLITQANIELAAQPRLDASSIENAQKQIYSGLQKIYTLAPDSVRPQMEAHYGSIMLNQAQTLSYRMLSEQKQDRQNNLDLSNRVNVQSALTLGMSDINLDKNGDSKPGLMTIETVTKANESALKMYDTTPLKAKIAIDSTRQAYLSGREIRKALEAQKNQKFAEYKKQLAENPPHDIQPIDHDAVYNNVMQYMNMQQQLINEDQLIKMAQYSERIIQNPNTITGSEFAQWQSNLTPLNAEKLKVELFKALHTRNKENEAESALIAGWGNATIYSQGTATNKNAVFRKLVNSQMQSMQMQGTPISQDEAEVQVAASAAGTVPGYVTELNTKLKSTNPTDLESAGKAVTSMFARKKGGNLSGLTGEAQATNNLYMALRKSKPVQDAADEAYNAVYNQSTEDKKVVDDSWVDTDKLIKSSVGKLKYYTDVAGISVDNLVDPLGFVEQAESMLKANFKLTKGDLETAKQMTTDQIKNSYGETHVNGRNETVFYPLEEAIGIGSDGVGYIQDDIVDFVNKQLGPTKEAFEKGALPYYWEIEPRRSEENVQKGNFPSLTSAYLLDIESIRSAKQQKLINQYHYGSEIKIRKHWKNGVTETFPLIVKADPWLSRTSDATKPYTAGWDVVLGTKNGYIPLPRANPMMGAVIVYKPDIEKIKGQYAKHHG